MHSAKYYCTTKAQINYIIEFEQILLTNNNVQNVIPV